MNPEVLISNADFVRNLARMLVGDSHYAEDVAQETWLAAVKNPPTGESSIRAWFNSVVRNLSINLRKKESRQRALDGFRMDSREVSTPDDLLSRRTIQVRLMEAVVALKDPYRTAIMLRFYENMPPREIASHLSIPVDTVKTHLKRALSKLKQDLDKRYGGDRDKWILALAPVAGFKLKGLVNPATGPVAIASAGVLVLSMKAKVSIVLCLLVATVTIALILQNQFGSGVSSLNGSTINKEGAEGEEGNSTKAAILSEGANLDHRVDKDKVAIQSGKKLMRISGRVFSRKNGFTVSNANAALTLLPHDANIGAHDGITDLDGYFSIAVPLDENHGFDRFDLCVSGDDFGKLQTTLPLDADEESIDCGVFYLDKNERFTVRITDEAGEGVPGAKLDCYSGSIMRPVLTKIADQNGDLHLSRQELAADRRFIKDMAFYVTADRMADHLYIDRIDKSASDAKTPLKIVMASKSNWRGLVVDKETRQGIAGALVRITTSYSSIMLLTRRFFAITDSAGRFAMPRITFEGRHKWSLEISAGGYIPSSSVMGPISEVIELKKAKDAVPCFAIDKATGQVLPDLMMRINLNQYLITDGSGQFYMSFQGRPPYYIDLYAPEEKLFYNDTLDYSDLEKAPLKIPLYRPVRASLKVYVRDEIGRPVINANMKLKIHGSYMQERFTGADGSGCFDIMEKSPLEADITITHPGFASFRSGVLHLFSKKDARYSFVETEGDYTFVLKRGTLLQNIKVVDSEGAPVIGAEIAGRITLNDGTVMDLLGCADYSGCCDLTFPAFTVGALFIKDRPDTMINISYDQVIDGDEIELVLTDPDLSANSIKGVIRDETGKPIEGIRVSPFLMDQEFKHLDTAITDKNGRFCCPVDRTKIYRVSLLVPMGIDRFNNWLFPVGKRANLSAGAWLDITLNSEDLTGVRISMSPLFEGEPKGKEFFKSKFESPDCEAWLETEKSVLIEQAKVMFFLDQVIFTRTPVSKLKGVVLFKSGERFETPFFNIEKSKIIHKDIIVTK